MNKIGLAIQLKEDIVAFEAQLKKAQELGFEFVQIALWDMKKLNKEGAQETKALLDKYNLKSTELWCGWIRPAEWNFVDGPSTLGLVPTEYRQARLQNLIDAADFAETLGVTDIITHLGFIPTNPYDSDYVGVVQALKFLLKGYKDRGLFFCLETGQETPVIARRLIEDTKADNFGVNYDPANLILYGSANPVDGLDILAPFVRQIHVKDGTYPTNGYEIGKETALYDGSVNIDAFFAKLASLNFEGSLVIENEMRACSEEERWGHVVNAKKTCEDFVASKK
ncbi:MAG: sugar phosphate isomerase/epimerase family protein [Eubacteriales bacterium]